MNAQDIMTTDVATVGLQATVAEAIRLMVERRMSGIPVLAGNGEVQGIITEGDLLRRAELGTEAERPRWLELLLGSGLLAKDYVDAHTRKVSDLMTRDVIVATPDTPLAELVRLMERWKVKRLPVIHDGVCVGIVSRADLVRALGRLLGTTGTRESTDEGIRDYILAELNNRKGARVTT